MYYPCSENKGADQLRGHREADLRLCFSILADCWFSHQAAQMSTISLDLLSIWNAICIKHWFLMYDNMQTTRTINTKTIYFRIFVNDVTPLALIISCMDLRVNDHAIAFKALLKIPVLL